jgi:UPF0755 protein
MNRRSILQITGILFFAMAMTSFHFYQKIYGENVIKSGAIFIKSTDDFEKLLKIISPFLEDVDDFIWVSKKKKYTNIKAGRYVLKQEMSANDVVNLLRSGNQTPVLVSFNNQDTLEKLAGRIAVQIEPDSLTLLTSFKDPEFLLQQKFTEKTILEIFIPNSYEFYWNSSAASFRNKMLKNYADFWTESRLKKAKDLGLTKSEISTLASIVGKETTQKSEQPTVAGLYLNRLRRGIPLQADPTIIYTIKEKKGQEFEVKRVLTKDLAIQSPYNTYLHRGLPPSLIAMPDISSIDAVLNAKTHNYIYMCVDVENLGFHAFASSLSQHNNNAAKYHRWLNKQGINR